MKNVNLRRVIISCMLSLTLTIMVICAPVAGYAYAEELTVNPPEETTVETSEEPVIPLEDAIAQTLFLNVTRNTPTAATFSTASESTFSVTFKISNDSTAGDVSRTMTGTYTLTYSGLNLISGPSASGTFSSLATGSPIYKTWTFQAPVGPSTATITLSAAVTSISPSRTFPTGGDQTSDSKSYTVNVLTPSDTTAPTGSITINSDATYTNSTSVTLNLSATDAVGVTGYRIINGTDASLPGATAYSVTSTTSYTDNISWTILTGDGTKTVAVQYRDAAGNWSYNYTDSIILDQTPPTVTWGSPSPAPNAYNWNNTDVSFSFTINDNLSGPDYASSDSSPLVISTEGNGVIGSITVYDLAGNSASYNSPSVNIDKTDPTLIFGPKSPSPTVWDWNNTDVTISFTAYDALSGVDFTTPYSSPLSFNTEGAAQTQDVTVTDKAGNSKTFTSQEVNIDKTKPVVTITVPEQGEGYILNQLVIANWGAEDPLSGINSAIGTVASGLPINTSSVGTKSFTVTAEDKAGNLETMTVTYNVYYDFIGVLQPINNDGSSIFKLKSTIPVKFQLKDANGNYINDAVARIFVKKISNGVNGGEIEAISTSAATEGNLFRYDFSDNQYIFNLGTKTLSTGTWQIIIRLNDGSEHTVNISLK